MEIHERLKTIMNHYDLNYNSFSKKLGISNNVTIGRIIKEGRNPSFEVLQKVIQTFGSINPTWLIVGEGEMIKNDHLNNSINQNQKKMIPFEIYQDQRKDLEKEQSRVDKLIDYLTNIGESQNIKQTAG